jgi:hypothetical protein
MDSKIKKAYAIANNAIYFDDNSDYETALYEVCMALCPEIDTNEIGTSYIPKQ